jgi:hypothetical protein
LWNIRSIQCSTCIPANHDNITVRTVCCSHNYFYENNDWKVGVVGSVLA